MLHRSPGAVTTFPTKRSAEAWLEAERKLIDDGRWTPPAERAVKSRGRQDDTGRLREAVAGSAQHRPTHT
ncbi:hypothetical protein [Mycolicibacterium sp. XJ879]